MTVLSKILVQLVRRNEFQADRFASERGRGLNLKTGLIKLFKENKADVDPDWMYASFNHTHPSLFTRLRAIDPFIKKND